MEITVITNRIFPVKVEETDTVLDIKRAIREVAHVPPERMILTTEEDVTMVDDMVVTEYGLKEGTNIELEILAPPADFTKYSDIEIVTKANKDLADFFGIMPGITVKVKCLDADCGSSHSNYFTFVPMGYGSFDLVAIRFACLRCRVCSGKAVPITSGFSDCILYIGGQKGETRLTKRYYVPAGIFREFDAISHVNWDILSAIATPRSY